MIDPDGNGKIGLIVSGARWVLTKAVQGAVWVYKKATAGVKKIFSKGSAKVGTQIGNYGKLVNNPHIIWSSSREHALNSMKKRGITKEQVNSWIINGKVIQRLAPKKV